MDSHTIILDLNSLPQRKLWFGTVAGAAAWMVQGFACVVISRLACSGRYANWAAPSETQALIILACISAFFLAIAISAGVVSFLNWRAVSSDAHFLHAEATTREQYMSLIGVFVNAAFSLGIIWAGLSLLLVGVCAWER